MKNNKSIAQKYEETWKELLGNRGVLAFNEYERNIPLPSLFKRGEKFLDLASGNALVGEYAQKKFNCQVVAMDISPEAIKDAQRRGVTGIVGSVEEPLPFKNNSFDTVFWGDNIEHVFFPKQVLVEIYRILKPSGRLIVSTPNQAYWRYRLYTLVTGKLPRTEGYENQPWEWTHIRFFTRDILEELLGLTGFHRTKFIGVSRRRLDRPLLRLSPELFGMIFIIEAVKNT